LEERESFLKQIIVVITAAVVGVSAMERHLCCMSICRLKFLSSVVGVGKGRPGAWYKYQPIFVTVIQSACIHR
jgi:hypothetical protein